FFFDSDDEGANPFDRPSIRAFGVGIEYVLKPTPANWILYVEYLGSLMSEGYFDDVEEPAAHDDGDWVRPDNLGMVALGANYGYETMLSRWLSLVGGGGLGVGVVTGQLTQWNPGTDPDILDQECGLETAAAYERVNHCSNDGAKDIPRVLPTGDMSASFRIHFAEQASLRIEGGFHNMLYTGVAVGAVF
ncbi:MAG: hypothetical protein QGG40_11830, partial [Myxococcota bacterium]|nr:hypothetical protein [Myxococcota bacterium]